MAVLNCGLTRLSALCARGEAVVCEGWGVQGGACCGGSLNGAAGSACVATSPALCGASAFHGDWHPDERRLYDTLIISVAHRRALQYFQLGPFFGYSFLALRDSRGRFSGRLGALARCCGGCLLCGYSTAYNGAGGTPGFGRGAGPPDSGRGCGRGGGVGSGSECTCVVGGYSDTIHKNMYPNNPNFVHALQIFTFVDVRTANRF